MRKQYRIVTDRYCGYEVQSRSLCWPFWTMERINTFYSVEAAEKYADACVQKTVKNLGWKP